MSADSCLIFYGVRFEVSESEITSLEERTHPMMVVARKHGLQHYWGNFGGEVQRNLLFIGTKIGVLGPENSAEVVMAADQLAKIAAETERKLKAAGIAEAAAFWCQWNPDA